LTSLRRQPAPPHHCGIEILVQLSLYTGHVPEQALWQLEPQPSSVM
jgi:hypothetical protein